MEPIIIENVSKKYGNKTVLDGVNLTLTKGITGLLGPNGAGKTTLIRCLLDLLEHQGEIRWEEGKPSIGYLPQNFGIFQRLTTREALEYVGELKQCKKDAVEEALHATHLEGERNKQVSHLSGGMLRRLGIAQAILGNPGMLVLDEPTAGLDPMQRISIRNLIARLAKDRIVVLSTHIVEDIEHIASHLTILNQGKVAVHGKKSDILQPYQGKIGIVRIRESEWDELAHHAKILQFQAIEDGFTCTVYADPLPAGAKAVEPSLEDVYLDHVDTQIS